MLLRMPQVMKMVGVSNTTIWRMEKAGLFPARKRISAGAVGWLASEVVAWLESRQAA